MRYPHAKLRHLEERVTFLSEELYAAMEALDMALGLGAFPATIATLRDRDAVLRETFFRERYPLALRRLEEVARSSTNEAEVAKARLFMGRSLVEMRRYRKAIDYFLMPDVRRHFPKEAEFWREYAISRTR